VLSVRWKPEVESCNVDANSLAAIGLSMYL